MKMELPYIDQPDIPLADSFVPGYLSAGTAQRLFVLGRVCSSS